MRPAAAAIAEKNKVPYIGVAFALQKVHQQGFKYLFSPFPAMWWISCCVCYTARTM